MSVVGSRKSLVVLTVCVTAVPVESRHGLNVVPSTDACQVIVTTEPDEI